MDIRWDLSVIDQLAGFLKTDPAGVRDLVDAIDALASDPRPADSTEFASPDVRRLYSGLYRVLYEIDEKNQVITIVVVHRIR